jgi:phytoene/squalene synthetase
VYITQMLRDMGDDLADGYFNIPREFLEERGISPEDIGGDAFRAWVRSRVQRARLYFREGKRYLDQLDVLRCKLAAYWYCARFECVLDAIERDGHILRPKYHERGKLSSKLKIGWLTVMLTYRHFIHRGKRGPWEAATHLGTDSSMNSSWGSLRQHSHDRSSGPL